MSLLAPETTKKIFLQIINLSREWFVTSPMVLWYMFVCALCWSSCRAFFEPTCDFCANYSENAVIKTSNLPHVDIFYLVIHNKKLEYIYKGHFWVLPAMAMLYSRPLTTQHPNITNNGLRDTRVHIVTDSATILEKARSFRFEAHDIKDYLQMLPSDLPKQIHDGVTSIEYEVTLLRWLIYDLIVTKWNLEAAAKTVLPIQRVIALDLDAMITYNAATFFHNSVDALSSSATSTSPRNQNHHHSEKESGLDSLSNGDDFEYINVALGAVSLFSSQGLNLFAKDVFHWFNDTEEVVNKRCRSFHPHFSDMILLSGFIKSNPLRRSSCLETFPSIPCLVQRMGCVPMHNYKSELINPTGLRAVFKYYGKHLPNWNFNETMQFSLSDIEQFGLHFDADSLPFCVMVLY